jgi:hypothetical protein
MDFSFRHPFASAIVDHDKLFIVDGLQDVAGVEQLWNLFRSPARIA